MSSLNNRIYYLFFERLDPSPSGSKTLDGFNQWPLISQNQSSARNEVDSEPLSYCTVAHFFILTQVLINIDRLHNVNGPGVQGGEGHAAIRQGNWKLCLGDPGPPDIWSMPVNASLHAMPFAMKPTVTAWNTTVQLFDVVKDEREENDVAAANMDVVRNDSKVPQSHTKKSLRTLIITRGTTYMYNWSS